MTIERVARFVYVACQVDDRRCGLDLQSVERVVRAVEITPLPQVPPIISGVINYHGAFAAVLNIRRWLRLPEREVWPEDKLVLLHGRRGLMGVIVDNVTDVIEASELDVVTVPDEQVGLHAMNVVKMKDGLMYVRSLDGLLNDTEAKALARAMGQF